MSLSVYPQLLCLDKLGEGIMGWEMAEENKCEYLGICDMGHRIQKLVFMQSQENSHRRVDVGLDVTGCG